MWIYFKGTVNKIRSFAKISINIEIETNLVWFFPKYRSQSNIEVQFNIDIFLYRFFRTNGQHDNSAMCTWCDCAHTHIPIMSCGQSGIYFVGTIRTRENNMSTHELLSYNNCTNIYAVTFTLQTAILYFYFLCLILRRYWVAYIFITFWQSHFYIRLP